ncbi:unnamed protein product, partial [Ixodes hexagonus]
EPSKSAAHKTKVPAFVNKEHHSALSHQLAMPRQGSIEDLAKELTTEVHSKHSHKDVLEENPRSFGGDYLLLLATSAGVLVIVIVFLAMMWGMFKGEPDGRPPLTTTRKSRTTKFIR